MTVLSKSKLESALEDLKGWSLKKDKIVKTYTLASFPFAIEFIHRIGDLAEEAQHHPDLDIRFNKVKVYLSTHDEDGITEKDIELAQRIELLLNEMTVI